MGTLRQMTVILNVKDPVSISYAHVCLMVQ